MSGSTMGSPCPGGSMVTNWMVPSLPHLAPAPAGPVLPGGCFGAMQGYPPAQKVATQGYPGASPARPGGQPGRMTGGGPGGANPESTKMMMYTHQAAMYYPPPPGMFPFPHGMMPGARPMRPEDLNGFISTMCAATGMTPGMLYTCLGQSLGAGGTFPGCAYPGQGSHQFPQVLSATTTVAQSESEANSCPNPGSTANLFGPMPSMSDNTQAVLGSGQEFLTPAPVVKGAPRPYAGASQGVANSAQNFLGPAPEVSGSAKNFSEAAQDGGLPNECSTQVSGTSNERPRGDSGEQLSQWGSPSPLMRTTTAQNNNGQLGQPTNNIASGRSGSDGLEMQQPGSGDHMLEAPSLVSSHMSAGSNMWSPSPSPALSPLLTARLPDFSPPFCSMERFGSSTPPTPALCPMERVASPPGLSALDRGGTFTLAEIFAEIGDAGIPSSLSPPRNAPLGSLAAADAEANQKMTPGLSSHGLTAGFAFLGNGALDGCFLKNPDGDLEEAAGKGPDATQGDERCDDLVSSASMPGDRDDGKEAAGEGAESAVSPLSLSWSQSPPPMSSSSLSLGLQPLAPPVPPLLAPILHSGSDMSSFASEEDNRASHHHPSSSQRQPTPDLSMLAPRQPCLGQLQMFPAAQLEVHHTNIMQLDGYHTASWQVSEGAPDDGSQPGEASWHMQLEDACSPAGVPAAPRAPLPNAAFGGRDAGQPAATNRRAAASASKRKAKGPAPKGSETALETELQKSQTGAPKKRVRKGKNKAAATAGDGFNQSVATELASGALSLPPFGLQSPPPVSGPPAPEAAPKPARLETAASENRPSSLAETPQSPAQLPAGTPGAKKGDAPKEAALEEGARRPEIEAILRMAHSQGGAGGTQKGGSQAGKKKSPEEILREAFQASMAAKAKENPLGGGKKEPCTEPQALAARARRERVNARMRTLQSLVPGAANLTTENFLLEAVQHVTSMLHRVVELTKPVADPDAMLGPPKDAQSVPSGSKWGWPQEPELVARNLQLLPIGSISALAAEGGVLDALLSNLTDEIPDDYCAMGEDDLEDFEDF